MARESAKVNREWIFDGKEHSVESLPDGGWLVDGVEVNTDSPLAEVIRGSSIPFFLSQNPEGIRYACVYPAPGQSEEEFFADDSKYGKIFGADDLKSR